MKIYFVTILIVFFIACSGPARISIPSVDLTPSSDEEGSQETPTDNPEGSDDDLNSATSTSELVSYLLIDGTVYTGTDWNGDPTIGVWGEPFEFNMADYPLTWAIALVHASRLMQNRGLNFSPNAVLSFAIKESRLGCMAANFPNEDGCFQIESTTAYTELQRVYPKIFLLPHERVVGGTHFEGSAIAMAYYLFFSVGMFELYSDDPLSYLSQHLDPYAQIKVFAASYNRGLWWDALDGIFNDCPVTDITQCFGGNAIAIDHASSIADYTQALDSAATPFESSVSLIDIQNYWESIHSLYSGVDQETVSKLLDTYYSDDAGSDGVIQFGSELNALLDYLMDQLPEAPSEIEVTTSLCSMGYLWEQPPCESEK